MNFTNHSSLISLTEKEFHDIISFVYKNYGIDLSNKKKLIEGRLSYTLKSRGIQSFTEYLKLLQQDTTASEVKLFLNKITTNHSYFARENDHFDFLIQQALPYLEKHRNHDLRTWSAGCSYGQEPYNIAMAMDEYFGRRSLSWDTTILASDISSEVLQKAKNGIYPANNMTSLPPSWKEKYFQKISDDSYQVTEKIRKEVVFQNFNLMHPIKPKKPFDIIFCRNVMIYFDNETTNQLIERFYQATAWGGYLFIGHSESIDKNRTKYTYIRPAVYQKLPKKGI